MDVVFRRGAARVAFSSLLVRRRSESLSDKQINPTMYPARALCTSIAIRKYRAIGRASFLGGL